MSPPRTPSLLPSLEFRTTVPGQQILIVQPADTTIAAGAAVRGTEDIHAPELLFQDIGVVVDVIAVSAAACIRCYFCAEKD